VSPPPGCDTKSGPRCGSRARRGSVVAVMVVLGEAPARMRHAIGGSSRAFLYPSDQNLHLNFHMDNSIHSNHSEEHCHGGKRERCSFELSELLDLRICCPETITTLKSVYDRSLLELQQLIVFKNLKEPNVKAAIRLIIDF
jgi:hypothetical protein